jgi:hypothetical protein
LRFLSPFVFTSLSNDDGWFENLLGQELLDSPGRPFSARPPDAVIKPPPKIAVRTPPISCAPVLSR